MLLKNISHKKGWIRLIIVLSPITGYIISNFFDKIFDWWSNIHIGEYHYLKIEVIIGFITGMILHIVSFLIILFLIDWVIDGFKN